MRVEASPVSQTTKRDASVLGSCVQRKFAPAPIWTKAMLAALQIGLKASHYTQVFPVDFEFGEMTAQGGGNGVERGRIQDDRTGR